MTVVAEPRVVVLVEGPTDQAALRTLARRHKRDLDAEGISIMAIGGAMNIRTALALLGAPRPDVRFAGLCDDREAPYFQRALEDAGFGTEISREDMERLGFYVCVRDLEDELIRALGAPAVEVVLAQHGELDSFRTMRKQPAWRERPPEEQLRRFLCSQSRRGPAATWLVEALDLDRVPRPLDRLLVYL
ncbi:MAG: ATP-dependent endonuclease [Actinobacteria bacterium]|nr:ATP-dependent endonuclease [Actinomycetota bacterium]